MKKTRISSKIARIGAAAALAAAIAPTAAFASTAETEVMLSIDDTQLSVTAPTTVDIAMKADGSFVAPDAASAKIVNKSTMGVSVKGFAVAAAANTNPVAKSGFDASSEANAWWSSVAANGEGEVPFSVSQAALGSAWSMEKAGADGSELELTIAGSMKALDGSIDYSSAQELATVTWTFSAAKNS